MGQGCPYLPPAQERRVRDPTQSPSQGSPNSSTLCVPPPGCAGRSPGASSKRSHKIRFNWAPQGTEEKRRKRGWSSWCPWTCAKTLGVGLRCDDGGRALVCASAKWRHGDSFLRLGLVTAAQGAPARACGAIGARELPEVGHVLPASVPTPPLRRGHCRFSQMRQWTLRGAGLRVGPPGAADESRARALPFLPGPLGRALAPG